MPRPRSLPKGARYRGAGIQTNCRVNGKLVPPKTWPINTSDTDLVAWYEQQRKAYATDAATGFGADIDTYMGKQKLMSRRDKHQRRQHLLYFADVFGTVISRHAITGDMVADALNTLRGTRTLGTVRNYKIALRAFFYAMNGTDGANPVRKAKLPTPPKPVAKGRSMDTIARVLDAFPDKTSGGYHRSRVIAYTGIPPALLMRIVPADLLPTPNAPTHVQVPERKKGAGVESRLLKLSAPAREAFAAFHQSNLYGYFHTQSVNTAVKRAANRIGIATGQRRFSLYHLRHSFLTEMYRRTRDTATTGRFAMHAEGSKETLMYVAAANADVDNDAIAAWDAANPTTPNPTPAAPVQVPATKLSAKVVSVRKLRIVRRLQRTA